MPENPLNGGRAEVSCEAKGGGGLRLSPQPLVLTLALQRHEEFSFTSLNQE